MHRTPTRKVFTSGPNSFPRSAFSQPPNDSVPGANLHIRQPKNSKRQACTFRGGGHPGNKSTRVDQTWWNVKMELKWIICGYVIGDMAMWMWSSWHQFNAAKTEMIWCSSSRNVSFLGPHWEATMITHPVSIPGYVYIDCDASVRIRVSRIMFTSLAALCQIRSTPFDRCFSRFYSRWSYLWYCHALTAAMRRWPAYKVVSLMSYSYWRELLLGSYSTSNLSLLSDVQSLQDLHRIDFKLACSLLLPARTAHLRYCWFGLSFVSPGRWKVIRCAVMIGTGVSNTVA